MKNPYLSSLKFLTIIISLCCLSNKSFGQQNINGTGNSSWQNQNCKNLTSQQENDGLTCDLETLIGNNQGDCSIGLPRYNQWYQDGKEDFSIEDGYQSSGIYLDSENYDFLDENGNNFINHYLPNFDQQFNTQNGEMISEWHKINIIMRGNAVPIGWVSGWDFNDGKWKAYVDPNNFDPESGTGTFGYTEFSIRSTGKEIGNRPIGGYFEFNNIVYNVINVDRHIVPAYWSDCTDQYLPIYEAIYGYNGININRLEDIPGQDLVTSNPYRSDIYRRVNGNTYIETYNDLPDVYFAEGDHADFYDANMGDGYGNCGPQFENVLFTDANLGDGYCSDQYEEFNCKFNGTSYVSHNPFGINGELCTIYGCTDSDALNYNSQATHNSGDCSYPGCADTTASNSYGTENMTVLLSFGYDEYGQIKIEDKVYYNDNNGNGYAQLISDYPDLAINIEGNYCTFLGCTDSLADLDSYNPLANQDDGTCDYLGCTDENSTNYNPQATVDDDTCIPIVTGCTDQTSCTYNSSANTHDEDMCLNEVHQLTVGSDNLKTEFISDYNGLSAVKISWNSLESEKSIKFFEIIRDGISIGGGNGVSGFNNDHADNEGQIEYDGIEQFYIDASTSFDNCRTYEYKVRTFSEQCSSGSSLIALSEGVEQLINEDISNTWVDQDLTIEYQEEVISDSDITSVTVIDTLNQKQLTVTEGIFDNRIQLSWENNNNQFIRSFEILKRVYSQNDETFIAVDEVENSIHHYIDYEVDTEVRYEYIVRAVIQSCQEDASGEDQYIYNDSWSQIGYCVGYGEIGGRVTFDDDAPVENVEVFAVAQNTSNNYSLVFDPTYTFSASQIEENDFDNFSMMSWIKPDFRGDTINSLLRPDMSGVEESNSDTNSACFASIISYSTSEQNTSSQQPQLFCSESDTSYSLFSKFVNIYSDSTIQLGFYEEPDSSEIKLSHGWNQVSITYNSNESILKIYVNGELSKSYSGDYSSLSSFIMHDFSGLGDEISFWDTDLDSSFIANNYDKYLNRRQDHLVAYYHFDEGFGTTVYDYSVSASNILNANHLQLYDELSASALSDLYSSDIPDNIKFSGLSDENGYFTISEVRTPNFVVYNSTIPFELTPTKAAVYTYDSDGTYVLAEPAHEFSPTHRQINITGGSQISDVNFTDESSFELNGVVYFVDPSGDGDPIYDLNGLLTSVNDTIYGANDPDPNVDNNNSNPTNPTRTAFGVQGVKILIDNEYQYDNNGDTIVTNDDGSFQISVPIGKHQISVEKLGHDFVEDVWNSADHTVIDINENTSDASTLNVYNFTSNPSGVIKFYDKTKKTLVGRVCGGSTEAAKLYDRSSLNNIGVATFTLTSGEDGHSTVVQTDSITGEYIVDLLPLNYNIRVNSSESREFYINNDAAENYFVGGDNPYLGEIPSLDLSQYIIPSSSQTFTERINNQNISREYHLAQNFVYRKKPEIDIYTSKIQNVLNNSNCSDSTALNYNSDAQIDNDFTSCYYDNDVLGCPDSSAINYNLDVTYNDGSCYYDYDIFGCTDQYALNYDSTATYDDGNCQEAPGGGCNDQKAANYDLTATYDDGSCEYKILGKTQWSILNMSWNEDSMAWIDEDDIFIPLINFEDPNSLYQMGYPVFQKNKSYNIITLVSEKYFNYDDYTEEGFLYSDTVKEGSITLTDGQGSNIYPMDSSFVEVVFQPSEVNTSLNQGTQSSFVKNITITYNNTEGTISNDITQTFYVFGSAPDEGVTFFSTGPEVVEMVLRDPPGDASYSYYTQESAEISSVIITDEFGQETSVGAEFKFGAGSMISPFIIGPTYTFELDNTLELEAIGHQSEVNFEEYIDQYLTSTTYSTSSEEYNIGSGGDIYIAKAFNILYGTSRNLEIIDIEDCKNEGVVCLGEENITNPSALDTLNNATVLYDSDNNSYTIGYYTDLLVDPAGFSTKTVYDQNHIVNLLIPKLEFLRNLIISTSPYETDPTNVCFDNEEHPNYLDTLSIDSLGIPTLNFNPCYTYNQAMDNSDPYELNFNIFKDLVLSDFFGGTGRDGDGIEESVEGCLDPSAINYNLDVTYDDGSCYYQGSSMLDEFDDTEYFSDAASSMTDDFLTIVENAITESQINGTWNGFSEDTQDDMNDIISASEEGGSALVGVIASLGDRFWDELNSYVGGIDFLSPLDEFKDFALDFYSGLSDVYDNLFGNLNTFLDGINNTPVYDKVAFYNQQIKLWKEAVRKNEEDKATIFDDSGATTSFGESTNSGPDENYSLSGGNVIEESYLNSSEDISQYSINYQIDGSMSWAMGMEIDNNGYNIQVPSLTLDYTFERQTTTSDQNSNEFGYILSDNDESDFLSIDVKESNIGWGPIFRKRAGETMCPHEGEESFLYYQHDSENNIFSPASQPREVPNIDIYPLSMVGVPEQEAAVFNLMLTNNSAAQQNQVFTIMVDEASNSHGAILNIDGQNIIREIMVPYGQTINKTLTVEKGPEWLDYTDLSDAGGANNSLGIILRSSCQYTYQTSNTPDIADTVYFEVSFTPGCSDISINTPNPNWVYNSTNQNGVDDWNDLNIEMSNYNWNYYSLDSVILQYKESNSSVWEAIETFPKFSDNNDVLDPSGTTSYDWNITNGLLDGPYDIRAYTKCGETYSYTDVHSGFKDTKIPELFGYISPADGILSTNDEIQINWSEQINENSFYANPQTSLNGIKNLSEISHGSYVFFDNQSSLNIPTGLNLQNSSFTIEMWIKPSSPGKLFEQGYQDNNLILSINENQNLSIQYDGITAVSSDSIALDGSWQHIAAVFDKDLGEVTFIVNGASDADAQSFYIDYQGEGPIVIGGDSYVGGIHELRVWSQNLHWSKIYQSMGLRLSGNSTGLKGYWPMDELHGTPQDIAQYRHMSGDVNWTVSEKGHGYNFNNDSNSFLSADIKDFFYDATDDFTIEFWFKSTEVNECILSTGSYNIDSLSGDRDAWSICIDEAGYISVEHNINSDSTSTILLNSIDSFNDASWHHLALVKDAKSNTTLYIDQTEQASCSSESTRGLLSGKIVLGAMWYSDAMNPTGTYSLNFDGKIDEVRIWGLKRSIDQLDRYQNIRLNGNELGLNLYYPFDKYFEDANGYISLIETYDDVAGSNDIINEGGSDSLYYISFESNDLPIISPNNPYQPILFDPVVNNDKIILNITDSPASVEGVIIDATMTEVKDLYGNPSEAISWSFYVDRNLLVWHQENLEIEKVLGGPYVFETSIINHGGSIESFEISNLPSWLTVSPSSGLLDPNSSTDIQFTIDESLFIGDYDCQIELIGNNEFAEILNLKVNVEALQPEFSLSSQNFEYTMNFIGKVLVDDIRSRDELDVLIAYVDNEVRGYASPTYIEEYDAYIIFLTVYSDQATGDTINFRVWDASEGKIQSEVIVSSDYINNTTDLLFLDGNVEGDFNNLVSFATNNILRQEIPLQQGWNWISLNLESYDNQPNGQVLIPTVTQNIDNSAVGIIRGLEEFYQYYVENGNGVYLGSGDGSLDLGKMYRVNINQLDTIIYDGNPVDLSDSLYNIDIVSGWNWIGYLGQRPLEINEALSSINPSTGDVIKSKNAFSMYASESLGWLGTLNLLSEGNGYMLNSSEDHVLIYPESSLYGSNNLRLANNQPSNLFWQVNQNKYENSMSIIARIDNPKFYYPSSENTLGAFNGIECTGSVNLTPFENDNSLYFLTVFGNNQDNISFKYYDIEEDITYRVNNTLKFVKNNVIGSIDDPYLIEINTDILSQNESFNLQIFPNPISQEFEIEFFIEESSEVEINISDVTGRKIKTLINETFNGGVQKIKTNSSELSAGVYILDCKIGEIKCQYKLVKN